MKYRILRSLRDLDPIARFPKNDDLRQNEQLRVLRIGLAQDGDVRVGIFPEREEILVAIRAL